MRNSPSIFVGILALALLAGSRFADAECPYPNDDYPDKNECETIQTEGNSECRLEPGYMVAVREITDEAQFATKTPVPIKLQANDGKGGRCAGNPKIPNAKIMMSITREPGGGFDLYAGKVIGHVHLESVPGVAGRIHWLRGRNELKFEKLDYIVYLIDEPQGGTTITKRYRLEIFDKNCQSQMPQENVNFGPKSNFQCLGERTQLRFLEEANSGEGYEPKK